MKYDHLVQIAKDMVTLTRSMSQQVKPDTKEAFELIDDFMKRVGSGKHNAALGKKEGGSGKYDVQIRSHLNETKAVITDELQHNSAHALRAQMRTQNAVWKEIFSTISAANRTVKAVDEITIFEKVPKVVPKNKPYISFRHDVVFTMKTRLPKTKMIRLPEKYEAVEYGSGQRWRQQLIVAFEDLGSQKKNNQYAEDLISTLNEGKVKYIPSFSTPAPVFFRHPGSKLIYVWLISAQVYNFAKMVVTSVMLPDSSQDEKPEESIRDKRDATDNLKTLREEFNKIIREDSQLKLLNEQKARMEMANKPLNPVIAKIKERTDALLKAFKKQNMK